MRWPVLRSNAPKVASGSGAEPETKSAPTVRVGRVHRALEHLPDTVQNHSDAHDRCGVGANDPAFGADGLRREGVKDGEDRKGGKDGANDNAGGECK